ncbi:MAG: NAD(P)-dependent oxidoreductase [Euryarchaeota archaeon]|nr:NAD(P)-dependent oxidoreductase [Euryarchaeota archaeon]
MALNPVRVKHRELDPKTRSRTYDEAILGYTQEAAREEAARCINCRTKPCQYACPALTRAPEYIKAIEEGDFTKSLRISLETYPISGSLGRTCFHPCEDACVVGKKGQPVAIMMLKRAADDYGVWPGAPDIELPKPTGKRVAIIGSGPAGLAAATDLAKRGHKAIVYEKLPVLGGYLTVGIPAYRLPRDVFQREVEHMKLWGVEFQTKQALGEQLTMPGLLKDHDAVFVGVGSHTPRKMGIPGEDLRHVEPAVDWLRRFELKEPVACEGKVVVIGGGSVAMDASRNALRLGAQSVTIVYRRGKRQMPASPEELDQARDEGIKFIMLSNPTRLIGDDEGNVKYVECVQMELGPADESGRQTPQPVPNTEFLLRSHLAIVAIGQNASPVKQALTGFVDMDRYGGVQTNPDLSTKTPGVYAAGDVVLGPSSIIESVGQAKKAAAAMHRYLMGIKPPGEPAKAAPPAVAA